MARVSSEPTIVVTDAWRAAFPESRVGVLVLDQVANPPSHPDLEQRAREVETSLRQQWAGADRATLENLPAIQAYQRHYRAFGQTYHVLRQLESVALKDKPLTSPSALVLAMFTVELQTLLLTAGHDLDSVQSPLVMDRSSAGERFIGISEKEHVMREGDMLIRDAAGIVSAVIYGPDQRTRLRDQTQHALFTVYAPAGVSDDAVCHHLEELAALVRLVSPPAITRRLAIYPATA